MKPKNKYETELARLSKLPETPDNISIAEYMAFFHEENLSHCILTSFEQWLVEQIPLWLEKTPLSVRNFYTELKEAAPLNQYPNLEWNWKALKTLRGKCLTNKLLQKYQCKAYFEVYLNVISSRRAETKFQIIEATDLPIVGDCIYATKRQVYLPITKKNIFVFHPRWVYIPDQPFQIICKDGKQYEAVRSYPMSYNNLFMHSTEFYYDVTLNKSCKAGIIELWNQQIILTLNLGQCILSNAKNNANCLDIYGCEEVDPEREYTLEQRFRFMEVERRLSQYLSKPFEEITNGMSI